MLKLRPHHLLDLISDLGAGINHKNRHPHPFGAAVNEVGNRLFSNRNVKFQLVDRIDDICLSCVQLKNRVCETVLSPGLLMRDYNDPLDDAIFSLLKFMVNEVIDLQQFIMRLTPCLASVIDLFIPPNISTELRYQRSHKGILQLKENNYCIKQL